jgi:hypothetical protein
MWNEGHVSFSEVSTYQKCGWSHKLLYIDELSKDPEINPPTIHTAWGTALHNTIENLLVDNIKMEDVEEYFLSELNKENSKLPSSILEEKDFAKFQDKIISYSPGAIRSVPNRLREILGDGYTVLGAELEFKQPVSELFHWSENANLKNREVILNTKFKGLIDCLILDSKGKFHIFDWKTTEKGWTPFKRQDPTVAYQLAIYKSILMSNIGLYSDNDPVKFSKRIKCHFLLFKPGDKPMEDYTPPVGPKVMNDALEWVNRAVIAIDRKLFLKNFNSCRFCPFAGTERCSGSKKYVSDK